MSKLTSLLLSFFEGKSLNVAACTELHRHHRQGGSNPQVKDMEQRDGTCLSPLTLEPEMPPLCHNLISCYSHFSRKSFLLFGVRACQHSAFPSCHPLFPCSSLCSSAAEIKFSFSPAVQFKQLFSLLGSLPKLCLSHCVTQRA